MKKNRILFFRFSLLFFLLYSSFFISSSFCQSPPLFEHFAVKNGLPSEKIYDAAQSSDGNIWFATGKGVCKFDGISFTSYGESSGLKDPEITGLLIDASGKLWCWSVAGQIFFYQNNRFSPLKINAQLSAKIDNRIINIVIGDSENNLWIATVIAGDLLKISAENKIEEMHFAEKNDFSFFIKQTGERNFVFGSLRSKEENNKLMVFLSEGQYLVTLSEKGNFSKSSFFPMKNVRLNDKAGQGEFLYAKGQEIIHFRSGKIIQRTFAEKNVEDIIRDSEGKIWVGLYTGGVVCYPEGALTSAGMINYLGNKSVSSVLEDNAGNIWFSTLEDGIYYLPARSNLVYSSPEIYSEKSNSRTEETPKAITPKGVETLSGLNTPYSRVISTDTARYDTLPPTIYISGVKIMEQDTIIQNEYNLPYDKNFLKINFVGFAYSNPEAVKYKYKMLGVDKAWIYTDNTFAQYTTLPAGKYFFSVSAMNKNGYWSDSPAAVSFIIHPPFWKTWWFISLMIFVAVAAIAIFFFIRISQVKEKAEITRQMANAELQALRAQMNPHFIFNTLSSIQHFITTSETEAALKYLSKFAKLMRKIMDNSKKPAIPVKDEVEALRLYLELESLRFKNKFEYAITVGEEIDVNDDEIPPMLIQPYIENSIIHGIMNLPAGTYSSTETSAKAGKDGAGKISLQIKKQNEMIICIVEDNGIGREKSKEVNGKKNSSHISSGMSITKNRLEILNTLHGSKLSVNIIDLKDESQNAMGTRVEIFVPL